MNSGIAKDCSVIYPDFDEAVKLCIQEGVNCKVAKSDMSSTFRHVPMKKCQWHLLVMKAHHPVTNKLYYFVDKCLPFGSSISCAIFQEISDAIAFLVCYQTGKSNVNYLDDYLFAAALKRVCDWQVQVFLQICEQICFPVALEKTFWGTTILTFLGLLLDTQLQLICIPEDKIKKALDMVEFVLNKRNKKATVLQLQRLCGSLNFLCRCVVPGRTFLRRLYVQNGKLKQHHHVRITNENRMDLLTWKFFLTQPSAFYRPFIQLGIWDAQVLDLYTDASRNFKLGFGAFCGQDWTFGQWDEQFCERVQPSIEYLELYAVAVIKWLKIFKTGK